MKVQVGIADMQCSAYFDSGALTSVASQGLHEKLQATDYPSEKKRMLLRLADGIPRDQEVTMYRLPVELKGKRQMTDFVVIPGAKDNKILLGTDFLEDAMVCVNSPQRSWHYVDTISWEQFRDSPRDQRS